MGSGSDTEPAKGLLRSAVAIANAVKKSNSNKPFKCTYPGCAFEYNRQWKLNRHYCTHTNERPFKCQIEGCIKDYRSNSHLQRHVSISHSEDRKLTVYIRCPYPNCLRMFSNKWSLKKHSKTHTVEDPYKCSECELTFKKRNQLYFHAIVHSGKYLWVCDYCGEDFPTVRSLNRHKRAHKIYVCEDEKCNVQFDNWSSMRKHIQALHPITLECDHCKKVFKKKDSLKGHVLTHIPENERDVLKCPFKDCPRFYFHHRNLRQHIRGVHERKRYQCDFASCDQSFVHKASLCKHKQLHNPQNPAPSPRTPKPRQPRKDKGIPKKSMAAKLSGIILPREIDQIIAKNTVTPEVEEYLKREIFS